MEKITKHFQSFYLKVFIIYCIVSSTTSEGVTLNETTSLEQTVLKQYVFSNASKHWNHYVRKLLHNSLEIYFPNIIKYHSMASFVEAGRYIPYGRSVLLYLKYLPPHTKQVVVKLNQVKFMRDLVAHLLQTPLQTYRFSFHSLPITLRRTKPGHRFSLYYVLHPNFHLKIFAHYIYFSSNSFFKCYFGKLIVQSFLHHTKTISFRFKYCGIVPSFILYPPSHRLKMVLAVGYQVNFDSLITHSVIDSSKIISYQVKSNNTETSVSVIKLLTSESYFLRYELQVERYESIYISINIEQTHFIEVYDGPGTLYNILKPFVSENGKLLYTTTTFQSVMFLFTKNNTFSALVTYKTTMCMTLNKMVYVERNQSVLITSEIELNNAEINIMNFETRKELFLNITIHQMNYKGSNHSLCGFAGITSYDINTNGTFKKISTICHSNNNQENQYRNIYTQNSVVLLVLYSYKKYSNFSLVFSVSTSHCRAATMDICELEHDALSLKSNRLFSIRKNKCLILQHDYRQANISFFKLRRSARYGLAVVYYTVFSGIGLLRGKLCLNSSQIGGFLTDARCNNHFFPILYLKLD